MLWSWLLQPLRSYELLAPCLLPLLPVLFIEPSLVPLLADYPAPPPPLAPLAPPFRDGATASIGALHSASAIRSEPSLPSSNASTGRSPLVVLHYYLPQYWSSVSSDLLRLAENRSFWMRFFVFRSNLMFELTEFLFAFFFSGIFCPIVNEVKRGKIIYHLDL